MPVLVGDNARAMGFAEALLEHGVLAQAIRPPTVPPGTARLRLTFTAQHPDEEIERLADIVRMRILAHPTAAAIPAQ